MLYITDQKDFASPFGLLQGLLRLKKKLFDRVVFALPPSATGWTDNLPDLGIPSVTKIVEDFSYRGIIQAAKDEQVSCIAVDLDTHSHDTICKGLALHSTLPVLFVNRGDIIGELLNHVIFATDWSVSSEKALEQILALGSLIYELDIVHVISEKLTVKDMRELKDRLQRTRKICLDEGINAEAHIYAGNVAEEIVTASKDYRGSIIVVGSNTQRSLVKRIFKRSTIHTLIKNAAVPVFFVPYTAEGD